jgi:hypothetical protein
VLGTHGPRVAWRLGLMPTGYCWRVAAGWLGQVHRTQDGTVGARGRSLARLDTLMPTAVLLAAGTPGGTWRA